MKKPSPLIGPGSVAFVVGGSMGIGLACAEAFAARGAHVAIFARRPGPLAEATQAVESARRDDAQRVMALPLDAVDPDATGKVLGEAADALGPPDLLFCCAGAAQPDTFENVTVGQLDATLRVNLHTAWNAVQAMLPRMEGRGGTIVTTSSLAGLMGVFGYTDYSAAKFALIGFSEALRSELAPRGIGVSVLCPPDTQTPGLDAEDASKPAETQALAQTASLLSAEEVADALLAGLERERFLIVPGRQARWVARLARHFPGLARRIVDRSVRNAQRKAGRPG